MKCHATIPHEFFLEEPSYHSSVQFLVNTFLKYWYFAFFQFVATSADNMGTNAPSALKDVKTKRKEGRLKLLIIFISMPLLML